MSTREHDIKEMVSEIALREKRAFWRSWVYSGIALLAAALWLSYTVYKTNQLGDQAASLKIEIDQKRTELGETRKELEEKKKELSTAAAITGLSAEQLIALYDFGWESGRLPKTEINQDLVQQSFDADTARQQITSAGDTTRRSEVTVQYFPKNVDQNKVRAALQELGFKLDERSPLVTDVPTNAIWFGTNVNPEDAKLVAYTLMRAGIQIKLIERFSDSSGAYNGVPKQSLVQVGAKRALVNDRPLTVDQIRTLQL
jgi:preprotein translocase subunit SecF